VVGRQDVVIVGGGVIGCSVAYYLSAAGVRCCVVEKGNIGAEASRAAAGLLAPQSESIHNHDLRMMGRESLRMFPLLSQELLDSTGIDVELAPTGILKLAADAAEADAIKGTISSTERALIKASWLDPDELTRVEPCLSNLMHGALLSSEECHINGFKLTQALARASVGQGVQILQGSEVTGFLHHDGRIGGVKTNAGDIESHHVVLANGAWSGGGLASLLGLNLPVRPVRGQILALQPATSDIPLRHCVYGAGMYLVPKRDGSIWVGATVEEVGFQQQVTVEGVVGLLQKGMQIMPGLQQASFQRAWVGLRPGSPDDMPILGPTGKIGGLVLATGHFRSGILLAPITGKLIAEHILSGDLAPLRPYSVDRFTVS
jgi:glycine oxidase